MAHKILVLLIICLVGLGVISVKAYEEDGCTAPDNFRCVDYHQWPDYYCGQGWVKRNCKKMCGRCNMQDESDESGQQQQQTVHESGQTDNQVTEVVQPGCDVSDSFHCYEYFNEKEYYCGQTWLQNNCRYMCGTCGKKGATETQTPRDKSIELFTNGCDVPDNYRCDSYRDSKDHYCRQVWVMQNCKYLCGSCGVIRVQETTMAPTTTAAITTRRPLTTTMRPTTPPPQTTRKQTEEKGSGKDDKINDSNKGKNVVKTKENNEEEESNKIEEHHVKTTTNNHVQLDQKLIQSMLKTTSVKEGGENTSEDWLTEKEESEGGEEENASKPTVSPININKPTIRRLGEISENDIIALIRTNENQQGSYALGEEEEEEEEEGKGEKRFVIQMNERVEERTNPESEESESFSGYEMESETESENAEPETSSNLGKESKKYEEKTEEPESVERESDEPESKLNRKQETSKPETNSESGEESELNEEESEKEESRQEPVTDVETRAERESDNEYTPNTISEKDINSERELQKENLSEDSSDVEDEIERRSEDKKPETINGEQEIAEQESDNKKEEEITSKETTKSPLSYIKDINVRRNELILSKKPKDKMDEERENNEKGMETSDSETESSKASDREEGNGSDVKPEAIVTTVPKTTVVVSTTTTTKAPYPKEKTTFELTEEEREKLVELMKKFEREEEKRNGDKVSKDREQTKVENKENVITTQPSIQKENTEMKVPKIDGEDKKELVENPMDTNQVVIPKKVIVPMRQVESEIVEDGGYKEELVMVENVRKITTDKYEIVKKEIVKKESIAEEKQDDIKTPKTEEEHDNIETAQTMSNAMLKELDSELREELEKVKSSYNAIKNMKEENAIIMKKNEDKNVIKEIMKGKNVDDDDMVEKQDTEIKDIDLSESNGTEKPTPKPTFGTSMEVTLRGSDESETNMTVDEPKKTKKSKERKNKMMQRIENLRKTRPTADEEEAKEVEKEAAVVNTTEMKKSRIRPRTKPTDIQKTRILGMPTNKTPVRGRKVNLTTGANEKEEDRRKSAIKTTSKTSTTRLTTKRIERTVKTATATPPQRTTIKRSTVMQTAENAISDEIVPVTTTMKHKPTFKPRTRQTKAEKAFKSTTGTTRTTTRKPKVDEALQIVDNDENGMMVLTSLDKNTITHVGQKIGIPIIDEPMERTGEEERESPAAADVGESGGADSSEKGRIRGEMRTEKEKFEQISNDEEEKKKLTDLGCKKLDHFRCFLLRNSRGLCNFAWFKRNCKYMCGECKERNLNTSSSATYENTLRIPVL